MCHLREVLHTLDVQRQQRLGGFVPGLHHDLLHGLGHVRELLVVGVQGIEFTAHIHKILAGVRNCTGIHTLGELGERLFVSLQDVEILPDQVFHEIQEKHQRCPDLIVVFFLHGPDFLAHLGAFVNEIQLVGSQAERKDVVRNLEVFLGRDHKGPVHQAPEVRCLAEFRLADDFVNVPDAADPRLFLAEFLQPQDLHLVGVRLHRRVFGFHGFHVHASWCPVTADAGSAADARLAAGLLRPPSVFPSSASGSAEALSFRR